MYDIVNVSLHDSSQRALSWRRQNLSYCHGGRARTCSAALRRLLQLQLHSVYIVAQARVILAKARAWQGQETSNTRKAVE